MVDFAHIRPIELVIEEMGSFLFQEFEPELDVLSEWKDRLAAAVAELKFQRFM